MQRLVLQSVLAAASALFILSATACDKGAEKKADVKNADDKKAEVVEPGPAPEPEPAGTTTTTGTVAAAETAGETGAGETGAGETGDAAPAADSGKEPEVEKTDTTKTDTTKTTTTKAEEPTTAKIDAKAIFDGKCKSCHGVDGKGDTTIGKKVNIPSLSATKMSKADVVKTITNGVPDTKMKGYADKLSKEEIDAVAAYVKKL